MVTISRPGVARKLAAKAAGVVQATEACSVAGGWPGHSV